MSFKEASNDEPIHMTKGELLDVAEKQRRLRAEIARLTRERDEARGEASDLRSAAKVTRRERDALRARAEQVEAEVERHERVRVQAEKSRDTERRIALEMTTERDALRSEVERLREAAREMHAQLVASLIGESMCVGKGDLDRWLAAFEAPTP